MVRRAGLSTPELRSYTNKLRKQELDFQDSVAQVEQEYPSFGKGGLALHTH